MLLSSASIEFAESPDTFDEVQTYFRTRGWTDGLPIMPPTPAKVEAMVTGSGLPPETVVGHLTPSLSPVTVEKVAINAVLAGCVPEYMPLILAAVEAIASPEYGLLPVGTNPCTPLMLVNGPIRHQLELNSGYCSLGGEERANGVIGRAIRLVMRNIGQGGGLKIQDRSTHGQPGRYTLCIAENEEVSPWEPLHAWLGYPKEASAVTLLSAVSLINIMDMDSRSPAGLLKSIAGSLPIQGSNNLYTGPGHVLLLLSPEHATFLNSFGYGRAEIQKYLFEHAWVRSDRYGPDVLKVLRAEGVVQDGLMRPVRRPEDFLIAVVGGYGPHSVFVTTFGKPPQAVTRILPNRVR